MRFWSATRLLFIDDQLNLFETIVFLAWPAGQRTPSEISEISEISEKLYSAPQISVQSFANDIALETMTPDHTIHINGIDEAAI